METAEKLDLDFAEFVGGPPVTVDPIEQQLAEGDARLDRAEEAIKRADEMFEAAEQARAAADTARRRADDLTISAGLMYIEAQAAAQLAGLKWKEVVLKSRYSERRVREVMAIARSSNPKRAAQEHRERTAAKVAKHREGRRGVTPEPVTPVSQEESGELSTHIEPREWFERTKTQVQSAPSMQWAHQLDNWYVLEYRPAMGFEVRAPKVGGSPKPTPKPAPTPKIADPRVEGAIGHFFESVPANKRLWVQQRMEEQPSPMRVEGVHIDWIKAFWGCTPEQQLAIKEGIKLENTKRMEG